VVGDMAATGELNVGDGVGAANSAAIESNDDLIIGRSAGTGTMQVKSDGRVELRTSSNPAELLIGENSTGTVIQTGGTVISDNNVRIGSNASSSGQYTISGGSLTTGSSPFQIGRNGATGTLHVEGTGQVTHGTTLYIGGDTANGASNGRLEIIGNTAAVQIGQLENTPGVRETIFWQASAGGVTPLVVTGAGPLGANRIQLQDLSEISGTNPGAGDGIALQLDLSAIVSAATLTLIDNRTTSEAITGLFENGTTSDLYQQGEMIIGTGFMGTVTISYLGGTGNDVVLNLVPLLGDHDHNGVVDGADYVVWRQTNVGGPQGYLDWRANLGATIPGPGAGGESDNFGIPEPAGSVLILVGLALTGLYRGRLVVHRHD